MSNGKLFGSGIGSFPWATTYLLGLLLTTTMGCKGEPIRSDEPNQAVLSCCEDVRARIEIARDVRSSNFRRDCQACRRGESKRRCKNAATRIQVSVWKLYGEAGFPASCESMRSTLASEGIELPALPTN